MAPRRSRRGDSSGANPSPPPTTPLPRHHRRGSPESRASTGEGGGEDLSALFAQEAVEPGRRPRVVVHRRLQPAVVAGAGRPPWPRGWQGGDRWGPWGVVAAGAPAPDLTPSSPILTAPARSGFRLALVTGAASVVGVGVTGGPEKSTAGYAGHDDGDA